MSGKHNINSYINDNVLDMSLLQLTEFPLRNKGCLPKSVTNVNLSNNVLTSVPALFCTFTQIRELDLSKNKLKMLPDQFGELVNLRRLDLYDNQITFLPLSFSKLQKLKWLDVASNPLPQALLTLAGTCQNTKECEQAATNIVRYFGLLKQQVVLEYEKTQKADKERTEDPVPTVKPKKHKNKGDRNIVSTDVTKSQPEMVETVNDENVVKDRYIFRNMCFYILLFVVIVIAYVYANHVIWDEVLDCVKTANCS